MKDNNQTGLLNTALFCIEHKLTSDQIWLACRYDSAGEKPSRGSPDYAELKMLIDDQDYIDPKYTPWLRRILALKVNGRLAEYIDGKLKQRQKSAPGKS